MKNTDHMPCGWIYFINVIVVPAIGKNKTFDILQFIQLIEQPTLITNFNGSDNIHVLRVRYVQFGRAVADEQVISVVADTPTLPWPGGRILNLMDISRVEAINHLVIERQLIQLVVEYR